MARASGCSLGSVWLLGFPIPGCNSVPSWCRSGRGLGCVHNQQQHCSMAMFNTYSTTEHQSTEHHAIPKHSFLTGKNIFDQNCFQKLCLCADRRPSFFLALTKHRHNSRWRPPTIGNPFRRPQTFSTNTSHPASIQSYTATWKSTPLPCPRPLVPIQSGPIAFFFE